MFSLKKMKFTSMFFLSFFLLIALSACGDSEEESSESEAENFPDKEIEIVTTFGQGGTEDLAAHAIANAIQEETGQSAVVTNKTGGSGIPGTMEMVESEPDGYTLEMVPSGQLNVRPLVQDTPYEFPSDFTPLIGVGDYQVNFVVNGDAPYDDMEEMIEYFKKNDKKIKIGTPGVNTYSHILGEWLSEETGVNIKHMPFDSGKKVASQILGDHVDIGIINGSDVYDEYKNEELKILGFPADERYESYPDVPTLEEQGIDIVGGPTFGMWAPADLPDDIQEKLADIIEEAMDSDEFKKLEESSNLEITKTPAQEMEEQIVEDEKNIQEIIEVNDLEEEE